MSRAIATNRVFLYSSDTVLFEDDFTGADGVAIDSSTPETALNQAAWIDNGTEPLVIASDKMSSSGVTGIATNYAYVDVQNQDLTIDTTINNNSGGFFASVDIIIRYVSNTDYIALAIDSKVGAPNMALIKWADGSSSELAVIQAADGTTYKNNDATVNIVDTGATITVTGSWANGTAISGSYSTTEMNQSTRAGIHCDASDMTISNFKVTKT